MYKIQIFHSDGRLCHTFEYDSYSSFTACYLAFTRDNSKRVIFYHDDDFSTVINLQYLAI